MGRGSGRRSYRGEEKRDLGPTANQRDVWNGRRRNYGFTGRGKEEMNDDRWAHKGGRAAAASPLSEPRRAVLCVR